MSPGVPGWSRCFGRVTGIFGSPAFSALRAATATASMAARSLAERRAAAEETVEALAGLPKRTLRALTMEVRCVGNELLLRVVRIPPHLPGARYDRYLVIPTSAVTFRGASDTERITAPAWFLAEHGSESSEVRCRCHPEVTLTVEHLRGESPLPPEIRIRGSLY